VPAIVKKTFAILEPAMTILLALVVLGAALSFFLALYKMVGSMGAGKCGRARRGRPGSP